MLRLITDFDGPIVDVSERYYQVYQFCLTQLQLPAQPIQQLPKAKFWQLKRARVPEREIGLLSGLTADQATEFAQLRRLTVHTQPYFGYDTLIPGAVTALETLQQTGVDLVVMTMRRTQELDYALEQYNLGRFFPSDRRYCLGNQTIKTADVSDKPLLMARALAELPVAADTWMVGDTEADIFAAKTYGIKVIGLLSGIRDRPQLTVYEPDYILEDLTIAVEFILQSYCV
ncbi:haloacid dehalogenase [Neosynechococcus sphagnicola sy1]|uniref:Haloacid dehalogenase n=1 Tax=Neosynechococcus sphagnicola sy1 TaxID=1497020 RepID=A0A098TMK8_9CYAN|nr:HAD family hydrolase [Neosynechococcus sphagnicola]KGF73549.1 haloacid dehalogenase [Neosynechococcus sphagnicola sy1]